MAHRLPISAHGCEHECREEIEDWLDSVEEWKFMD
jgi:hypothetical protein